jgi:hypothetical protein
MALALAQATVPGTTGQKKVYTGFGLFQTAIRFFVCARSTWFELGLGDEISQFCIYWLICACRRGFLDAVKIWGLAFRLLQLHACDNVF